MWGCGAFLGGSSEDLQWGEDDPAPAVQGDLKPEGGIRVLRGVPGMWGGAVVPWCGGTLIPEYGGDHIPR